MNILALICKKRHINIFCLFNPKSSSLLGYEFIPDDRLNSTSGIVFIHFFVVVPEEVSISCIYFLKHIVRNFKIIHEKLGIPVRFDFINDFTYI